MLMRWEMAKVLWTLLVLVLVKFVKNEDAGITSSYIRKPFPSTDIPLDDPVFAAPPGHNAPQQVHVIQGDYIGKEIIITWVTPDEPGFMGVEIDLYNYTFGQYKSGFIHQRVLSNLESGAFYDYLVIADGITRNFVYRAPPEVGPDTPYTFGIIADLGQTYNSLSTLRQLMSSKAEALLYLGGLSYADLYKNNDVGIRWDSWGRLVENSTARMSWFWCAGNHEIEYKPDMGELEPFKNYIYRYPTPYAASNSSSPLWYSFKRASAHVIVLSSYSPFVKFTPQWTWLRDELKKVNREETPWLIVVTHVPLYSSNEAHFMEGEGMRAEFEKWFIQYRVDVVFSGHVHAYERSHRYSNLRTDVSSGNCHPIPNKDAPIYITVGDGGNQEGLAASFREPKPEYSAFREASYGHGILEIKNRTHALYSWHRNDNDQNVVADEVVLHNQHWRSDPPQEKLEKQEIKSGVDEAATSSCPFYSS